MAHDWDGSSLGAALPAAAGRLDPLAYGLHLGARLPAHASSTGRVLLAALPESELSAWLEGRALARLTPYTVTDPGALRKILDQIRQQDFCIASEEHEIGVHAVAVPLRNLQGKTVGALDAVLPPQRLARGAIQRELLPLLQDAALDCGPFLRGSKIPGLSPTTGHQVTQYITPIEGGDALGNFRAQQLLPRLQAVSDKITGISARFVHLVDTLEPLSAEQLQQWQALLTYGEPYEGETAGALVVVTPRMGTVSPWASKATDIAHNCGLGDPARRARHRVPPDRSSPACSALKGSPSRQLSQELRRAAARPHDRIAWPEPRGRPSPVRRAQQAAPMAACGRAGLAAAPRWKQANRDLGLALSDDEIDYLVNAFTEPEAQPDRRRADDVRPGQLASTAATRSSTPTSPSTAQSRTRVLFGMIRNTHKLHPQYTVVAYCGQRRR